VHTRPPHKRSDGKLAAAAKLCQDSSAKPPLAIVAFLIVVAAVALILGAALAV